MSSPSLSLSLSLSLPILFDLKVFHHLYALLRYSFAGHAVLRTISKIEDEFLRRIETASKATVSDYGLLLLDRTKISVSFDDLTRRSSLFQNCYTIRRFLWKFKKFENFYLFCS